MCAVAGADGPGALDELQLAHAQHVGAHHARRARPAGDADDEDDHPVVLAPHGGQDHGQRQPGDHQEHVRERIPTSPRPTPVVAGPDADAGAEHRRDDRRQKPDDERDARAPDELGQHRLALLGRCPNQQVVARRRRLERRCRRSRVGSSIAWLARNGASRAMAAITMRIARPARPCQLLRKSFQIWRVFHTVRAGTLGIVAAPHPHTGAAGDNGQQSGRASSSPDGDRSARSAMGRRPRTSRPGRPHPWRSASIGGEGPSLRRDKADDAVDQEDDAQRTP